MNRVKRIEEKILYYARAYPKLNQLLAFIQEPVVEIEKALKELEEEGKIKVKGGKVEVLVESPFGVEDLRCRRCMGRGVEIPSSWLSEFRKAVKERPKPIQDFDQGYVTPESTVSRVAFMHFNGDLKGKEILILGDDDLVSICIGITGLAKRVVVLEADRRINQFINRIAGEMGWDMEAIDFNLLNPLPADFEEAFDTFETDPPETVWGIRAFVGRGIWALRKFGSGYFGLTRIESSAEKWLEFQKILANEFRVPVTAVINHFNFYEPWDYETKVESPREIWYNSALVKIEKLEESRGYNEKCEHDILRDEETITV